MIGASEGCVFVQADYSQIELRIAAMMANERNMLGMFHRGEDIHTNVACRLTGKTPDQITKEERKKGKSISFGYLFGMGATKYVEYARDNFDLDVTLEESEALRDRFFSEFPALRPWHDRQRRLAQRYHRVHSPIGRVRHLPDIVSGERSVQGEAERQAINSPVQSFASDLMLVSLIELNRRGVPIVGTVHDSILFDLPEDDVEDTLPMIREVMENPPVKRMFGADLTVPIEVDIETGTHWGDVS
jgi:DNA polymerase-1